jgi:CubicO group peptidase (beta-lactamase class C family)
MQRWALVSALIFSIASVAAVPACATGWSAAKQLEARGLVERFLKPSGGKAPQVTPALSLSIGINGELAWATGLGEERPGQPATADTVYRIGSITKQFTAAATLRLIERQAASRLTSRPLTLASPVADFLEGVEAWAVPGQSTITVRSLLNMTSNLPNFTRRPPPQLDPWGTVNSRDLLAAVKSYRPAGWPGSFEYSNTNYFLLSEIAAAVGVPGGPSEESDLHETLNRDIFPRAELVSTGFSGDAQLESRLPIATYRQKPVFSAPDWLRGSADMLSTAADLFRWNRALMSGAVIGESMLQEMLQEGGRVTPTTYYGMGWFIAPGDGWTHYSHTGSVAGYTSCNAIARSRDRLEWISVTLLSNSEGVEGLEQLADDLLQVIERD